MEEQKPVVEKKIKKPLSEERKAKIKQYQATYKNKNKQKSKDYMNEYVQKSVAIDCPCGGVFRNYSRYKHIRTQKHVQFFEQIEKYALEQKQEELNKVKIEVVNPLPLPASLDFINVEQTGTLLKLSEKKPVKKERANASNRATLKKGMEQYVEAVKEILSEPVVIVVSSEAEMDLKKPKVTRIKKQKVLKISEEMPVTTDYNVVA